MNTKNYTSGLVAPHTGAWIETCLEYTKSRPSLVAPHTGAWIETLPGDCLGIDGTVAPHTGAWIETMYFTTRQGFP